MSTTSKNRAPTLIKGNPFAIVVRSTINGTAVDYATTPLHVVIVNTNYRKVLKYVPGAGDNDGVLETPSGVSRVRFALTAEWTRVQANIPPGEYTIHIRPGAVDGMTGRSAKIYAWKVENLEDGEPFEVA